MKGLNLVSFRENLHKIKPDSKNPASRIKGWKKKLGPWIERLEEDYGKGFSILEKYHNLPFAAFARFSFDELCKIHHSSPIQMHNSVSKLFETSAQHEIIRKIESSMWRWSYDRSSWNEIVDAYDNLRHFTFMTNKDFEVRLDWTTWYNEFGYSKFSRTYLDGVFGFLVYYKGQHVMTIGFSVLVGRRVLIQQVQSAQRSGNRGLFKIPQNRVEFVIDLFFKNFPRYRFYLIDGESLVKKTLRDYERSLERNQEILRRWDQVSDFIERLQEEERELKNRKMHLELDMPRISRFYNSIGRHRFGADVISSNDLEHYKIISGRIRNFKL
ncbi:MAG TPA: hypothetical protein VEA59_05300 [Patescibacteria group bacterium]|nr:hypothetical protein [Patescibacteria group bacterium]